ncbi:helix-turn-helix domain-containing protein [Yoonia sp. SS1-5]|uniref:TetR/AcrR family transcriptional regulator n=1 Tax=Yoonia rhodophyticola TaxID=3137370 RepID=A0AAN0NGW9_9RHOB
MQEEDLKTKKEPSQKRANKTFDLILRTAAELLEDEGFEKLTTNKICAAAGMTPPALYRYFPNKYAILSELALRLMKLQNSELVRIGSKVREEGISRELMIDVLRQQVVVTQEHPGGVGILKTLYATPQLAEIRLSSHNDATQSILAILPELSERLGERAAHLRARLLVEIGNGLIEMIAENPDLDANVLIADTADIFLFHLEK